MHRKLIILNCLILLITINGVGQNFRYLFDKQSPLPNTCLVVAELFGTDGTLLLTEKSIVKTDTSKQIEVKFNFGKVNEQTLALAKELKFKLINISTNTLLDTSEKNDISEPAYQALVNKKQSNRLLSIENRLVELGLQQTVSFWYNGELVTYGVVKYKGRFWLDRNLGAQRVAISIHDTLSYGHMFQWGREDDGHQLFDFPAFEPELATDGHQPAHNVFISYGSFNDWNSNNKWNKRWHNGSPNVQVNNNVCPEGWHVPTQFEWEQAIIGWRNNSDALNSPLKLPSTNSVSDFNKLTFSNRPNHPSLSSFYWSSSTGAKAGESAALFLYNEGARVLDCYSNRSGFSLRCIKDVVSEK